MLNDMTIEEKPKKDSNSTDEHTSKYSKRKKQALARINEIEYEIIVLDNDLRTASSLNQKIELNIRIVELNDEKNSILDTILKTE